MYHGVQACTHHPEHVIKQMNYTIHTNQQTVRSISLQDLPSPDDARYSPKNEN